MVCYHHSRVNITAVYIIFEVIICAPDQLGKVQIKFFFFIFFYSILFYFILFYFILDYFILDQIRITCF